MKINNIRFIPKISFFLIAFYCSLPGNGQLQEQYSQEKIQLSAGYNTIIYQSVYAMNNTFGIELAANKSLSHQLQAQGGVRFGLQSFRPEAFLQLSARQQFGAWRPQIGIETGYSNRMYFDNESNTELLAETRAAMVNDLGHMYISSHVSILSFAAAKNWEISALEADFGTHFKHMGRTLRFQLTFLRIGRTF